MGQEETKAQFLTKTVQFNGQKMTLFSLDGNTWSTRKLELAEIKQRHELQRAELAGKPEEAAIEEKGKDLEQDSDQEDIDSDYKDTQQPFMIDDEEEALEGDEEETKPKKLPAARLRSKAAKPAGSFPAKPAFNQGKVKVKPDIKISPKKKEASNVVSSKSKIKAKPKKVEKKSATKKPLKKDKAIKKTATSKKRKAA